MNNTISILYPSVAMALMTLGLLLTMGIRRFLTIRRRGVSIGYYRTYDKGEEPAGMRQHTRHIQNHFELPLLFHLALLAIFATGEVSNANLTAAWFFVATRALHSVIHLGYNNVTHRFVVYGLGLFTVIYLWLNLLLSLLNTH